MGQYFDPAPTAPSRPSAVALAVRGLPDVELATDAGVFSGGRIDIGTAVLLEVAAVDGLVPAAGDLLDLGCGYGPIAVTLARRAPAATVWAVDVNERALALCAANASALGLGSIRAVEPAGVPADTSFAGIWSNPPIRVGKAALHALLDEWLPRLAPEGVAWLVVQKHLGADSLQSWLASERGFSCSREASRKGYRVLRVARGAA